ncbi:MAG TPA: SPOR domain-containing protein [Spirochaetota bacterium]|nr:SPOR domain-containing protein [Spirochaetota bacterium]
MENFNESFQQQKPIRKEVKEKSIYSLNLDGTRIAILCFIIVAIVAVTFLIGMKISDDESVKLPETATTSTDSGFISGDPLSTIPDEVPSSGTQTDLGSKETGVQSVKDPLFADNQSIKPDLDEKEEKTILSAKNNDSPVHSSKPKIASKHKKNNKVASTKKHDSAVKNTNVKPAFASVSRKNSEVRLPVSKGKFAVQVASFDTLSKAKSEVSYLKSLHFDAYIDKTSVDGQMYFRVKIGRLATKSEASDLLDKVQEESRYSESFIVKEI